MTARRGLFACGFAAFIATLSLIPLVAPAKLTRPELKCLSAPAYFPGAGMDFTRYVADDVAYLNADMLRVEFIGENDTDKPIFYPAYDYIASQAGSRGMSILGLLDYQTLGWSDRSEWATQEFRARFTLRIREIVTHYRDYEYPIRHWEIWNEEDIQLPEFNVRIDPEPYALLLIDAYEAIKAIDPQATVVLGGISPKGLYYSENYLDDLYNTTALQNYYTENAKYPFDVVAVHPYPDYGGFTVNSLKLELDTEVKAVMDAHADGDKKVWLTEMGWNSCLIPSADPEAAQAQYLTDSYALVDTQVPYVERYFWFRYSDFGTIDCWGLARRNYHEKKPAYDAYLALTDPGPEPPGDETDPGEDPPVWGSVSDLDLPVQVSDSDLIEGRMPTYVEGGFHPLSYGGVERLTNGSFDPELAAVVLRDYADHEPALLVRYEFERRVTIEEIRIFAGHFGDGGNRAFQSDDIYINGIPAALELTSGEYGQVSPNSYTSAVSVVRLLPETGASYVAQGVTSVDIQFYCTSSLNLDFRDRWSPYLDPDQDRDGADPAYVSPVIKEIDVLGFEEPTITDSGFLLY